MLTPHTAQGLHTVASPGAEPEVADPVCPRGYMGVPPIGAKGRRAPRAGAGLWPMPTEELA